MLSNKNRHSNHVYMCCVLHAQVCLNNSLHKVDDRLSDMAEVQCLCVMEGLYGGEDALSRFI